jgi:CBS domain-containing protein
LAGRAPASARLASFEQRIARQNAGILTWRNGKHAGRAHYRPDSFQKFGGYMKAKDVMTHCLVSITPDAPIRDAIARMISHQVSGMPVIDKDGTLVGMVTEGDFLRRAEMRTETPRPRWLEVVPEARDYVRSHGMTVRDVMAQNVVAVEPDTSLGEVVRVMEEFAIKRVPVVDGGLVVGIVSRADLVSALGTYLIEPKKTVASDDEEIRRAIVAQMKKQRWCPVQVVSVRVKNGLVTLSGTIFDERQRRALQVLAENVHGVRGVRDQLSACVGEGLDETEAVRRTPNHRLSASRRVGSRP